MKKAAWILCMTAGAFLGLKSDYPGHIPWGAVIGAAWLCGIGYGFGTIFDTKRVHRSIVAAWMMTLALVGIFFGVIIGVVGNPYLREWQVDVAGAAGACRGALLGYAIGRSQRRWILATPPSLRNLQRRDFAVCGIIAAQGDSLRKALEADPSLRSG